LDALVPPCITLLRFVNAPILLTAVVRLNIH